MNHRRSVRALLGVTTLSLSSLVACTSPLERTTTDQLREQMIASNRAQLKAAAQGGDITVSRKASSVDRDLTPKQIEELDKIGGPGSYREAKPDLGPDLTGDITTKDHNVVRMGLRDCIHLALRHNLEIQQGRLLPAISQTQITQSEAVFDAIFFTSFDFQNLDTPRPLTPSSSQFPTPDGGSPFGGTQQTETNKLTTGIKKTLGSGAQVSVQTSFTRNFSDPTFYTVKNHYVSDVSLSITQPLLRNFGADFAKAQIALAKSARYQSNQDLNKLLMDVVNATERSYWDLMFAIRRLYIQQRLLERTIKDYERVTQRKAFDVKPSVITDVAARVEARRADLIRARQFVRQSSDTLKRLINSPDLPLSSETLVIPSDEPAELPIVFSQLDAITQALRRRPDLIKALSQIDDAAVRLKVSDNARLPELNVAATLRFNGLGDNVDTAYESLGEGNFIDYLFGLQFEAPIGNRAAEAQFQQRTLERQALVTAYQRQVQDAILEIKNNLRDLNSAYELIGANRSTRRAAADNLRSLNVEEDAGAALTPEFIDLKLRREESLAIAEVEEAQAITNYNAVIPKLYLSIGTLLEKNGIEFAPDHPDERQNDYLRSINPGPITPVTQPAKK